MLGYVSDLHGFILSHAWYTLKISLGTEEMVHCVSALDISFWISQTHMKKAGLGKAVQPVITTVESLKQEDEASLLAGQGSQ